MYEEKEQVFAFWRRWRGGEGDGPSGVVSFWAMMPSPNNFAALALPVAIRRPAETKAQEYRPRLIRKVMLLIFALFCLPEKWDVNAKNNDAEKHEGPSSNDPHQNPHHTTRAQDPPMARP